MKTFFNLGLVLSAALMSQTVFAHADKTVRSDRISFMTQSQATVNVQASERITRSDRIAFNLPVMEQPSLRSKRIVRSDRIIFNQM